MNSVTYAGCIGAGQLSSLCPCFMYALVFTVLTVWEKNYLSPQNTSLFYVITRPSPDVTLSSSISHRANYHGKTWSTSRSTEKIQPWPTILWSPALQHPIRFLFPYFPYPVIFLFLNNSIKSRNQYLFIHLLIYLLVTWGQHSSTKSWQTLSSGV